MALYYTDYTGNETALFCCDLDLYPRARTWLNSSLQPEGVGPGPDLTDVMVDSYVPDLENRGELAF